MSATPVYDCIGLGISPADYICLLDHYPHADEKMHARAFVKQGGGPASTAMAALGRWGLRAALITVAGDDDDGRFAMRDLEAHGVDTRWFKLEPGLRSARSFILVDTSTGTRAVVTENTGTRLLRASDINTKTLPRARAFHTDGRDTTACLKAMRHYRAAGAAVVLDAGSARPRMDDITALTDHFVASHSFVKAMFGPRVKPETACRRILGKGPRAAIVTLAADGCCGATRNGGAFRIPGHRRDRFIVDTTGAGDIFHAGYIFGMLKGWNVDKSAAFGNAAAFLKCGSPGGRQGIASVQKILKLANTQPL